MVQPRSALRSGEGHPDERLELSDEFETPTGQRLPLLGDMALLSPVSIVKQDHASVVKTRSHYGHQPIPSALDGTGRPVADHQFEVLGHVHRSVVPDEAA